MMNGDKALIALSINSYLAHTQTFFVNSPIWREILFANFQDGEKKKSQFGHNFVAEPVIQAIGSEDLHVGNAD